MRHAKDVCSPLSTTSTSSMIRLTQVSCRRTLLYCVARSYHASQLTRAAARPQPSPRPTPSNMSDLGVRTDLPPDSDPEREPQAPPSMSDQDWEIRTARALYVLQNTLPDFFYSGLVTSIDGTTGSPRPSSSSIPILNANPLDSQSANNDGDREPIYSPKIQLTYTPPVTLPAPFPKTLHVEGLPLYLASSVFIRHTLNALYTDMTVIIKKVVLNTPTSASSKPSSPPVVPPDLQKKGQSEKRKSREKSAIIALWVSGVSRVSGTRGEWEVNSTYVFSPVTGLIYKHTIDSIHPAPHQAVYDSIRASLGKVFGLGLEGTRQTGAGGTACKSVDSNSNRSGAPIKTT